MQIRIERYTFDLHYGFHLNEQSRNKLYIRYILFLDFKQIIIVNSIAQAIMLGFCR